MTRLDLRRVRVCSRCGRGKAELAAPEGGGLEVALDAPRARDLAGQTDDVRALGAVVLDLLAGSGAQPSEVVLDVGPVGLRGLLSVVRDGESDVLACTAQEAVELSVRGKLPLYVTDEALAADAGGAPPSPPRHTVH